MKNADSRLVWLHLELDETRPDDNTAIVGIASAITDGELGSVTMGPTLRFAPDGREQAETECLAFLSEHVAAGAAPLAGAAAHKSRVLLAEQMPRVAEHLHYRNVDLATLRELIRRWHPEVPLPEPDDSGSIEEALRRGIDELRSYRASVFVEPAPTPDAQG